MKVYYINILLFAFPLNILVYNQWNHKSTTHHTPKVPTTRLLYECELYIPNYDNDPEMKRIMQQFDDRTSQRFHEYDNRMIEKQQKCKDQCDKEIQKIILKDKLEKELMEKFATLQTDIQNDAIPTCVCEKSLADKTEKFCLNCGKTMGAVAPAWGLISCIGYVGWSQYVAAKIVEAGIKNGLEVGLSKSMELIKEIYSFIEVFPKLELAPMFTAGKLSVENPFFGIVKHANNTVCGAIYPDEYSGFCVAMDAIDIRPTSIIKRYASKLTEIADASSKAVEAAEAAEASKYTSINSIYSTSIIAAVVAIVVVVLIMVIIYFILSYRRKKKMKRKIQYLKLLKE
ncbi:hypothetical protein PFUGPA_00140 [Plasmodium falciparum Palo Alto/Uganda]|uniref:Rifin n=2 Tax=Plasmodium falciparum TaxID=5833 RepID=W4J5Z9_PLAFP|nr:hypothetical protein PFUGPA_00140 [Plasmodium falciparum Palo Alto/Uganda]ETW63907.1 hypothetical protein PFMC_00142 [Plasmodium falciparum CAMP/Malaysia]